MASLPSRCSSSPVTQGQAGESRPPVEHLSAAGATLVQVRGSLIVSSRRTLHELKLYPRYVVNLPAPLHEPVLYALASSWVPCELALAHYAACDAMELSEQELQSVEEQTFLATLLRGTRLVGADMRPMAALQNYPRLWDRLLQGGSCKVRQTGPKDATIESRGLPMFRYRYFRFAYVGWIRGAGLMFGHTLYTRVLRSDDTALKIGLSWV